MENLVQVYESGFFWAIGVIFTAITSGFIYLYLDQKKTRAQVIQISTKVDFIIDDLEDFKYEIKENLKEMRQDSKETLKEVTGKIEKLYGLLIK